MKAAFGGVVSDGLIFPYPDPSRAEADQLRGVLDGLRRFAKNVDSNRIDREERIPDELVQALRDLGAYGMMLPKERGGGGLGVSAYTRAIQELAGYDGSIAMSVSGHQSLGATPLLVFASDALKERWLPRLASGEAFAAFALVEAGAGSDASSIQTRADWDGDAYVLSGEKIWVTNGGSADVFTVLARTSPAEDGAKPRLTAFLVERGPGVNVGPNAEKIGVCGVSTPTVVFDRVRVPAAHVLGEVGRGFKVAMEVLTRARLALAGSCVGAAKRLLRLAVERSLERKAFGRSISEFGLIKDRIALMAADIFALESMTYLTTGLVDAGRTDYAVESAICKVFGSEALWRVANAAVLIAGGVGHLRAAPYERMLRDARIMLVYEGTNDILRAFIALSGMQGPGRELVDAPSAMREPIKGFGLLTEFALRKARSVLSRERMAKAHPALSREAVLFEEYTALLARNVDKVLRRHGRNIAEMQFTQRRVADVAIDLYGIASCVSRASKAIERRGEEGARREIDLTAIYANAAERRLAANVASFDDNDDELRKAVAHKTCVDGGYPLDVI